MVAFNCAATARLLKRLGEAKHDAAWANVRSGSKEDIRDLLRRGVFSSPGVFDQDSGSEVKSLHPQFGSRPQPHCD